MGAVIIWWRNREKNEATTSALPALAIRDAASCDLDVIMEFTRSLASETEDVTLCDDTLRRGVSFALVDPSLTGESMSLTAASRAGLRPRYWICVDTSTSQPLGMVGISPEWSDWWGCEYWWVISIYVAPTARRQGVGMALLEHVAAAAESSGAQTVNLRVERENVTAQALYSRCGFALDDSHLVMARGKTPSGVIIGGAGKS